MPTKTPSQKAPKPDVNATKSANDLPHTATLEVTDNAPSSVLERRVKLTDTSMVIDPETTYEEAISLYDFTHVVRERSRWWLGDIVNFMEDHFPEKYTQAIDLTGLTYSRLTTICSVCRKIEPSRRRKEASFSWHEKVAYLPYQTADHLLDRGIKEKWTNEQFEDSVAKAKGEPTKAEKRAAKAGSTVAKVAASGKEPQIALLEGEKPLIWNGHPLSTRDRQLYQGPELLTVGEADQAAHFYGYPHYEALMNWLEEHNFIKGGDEPCAPNTTETSPSTAATRSTASAKTASASNDAAVVQPDSAPNLPQPEAPQTAQHASEPPAAPIEPKPTPEATSPILSELLEIMETYHEQDARGNVDTPGGLEHMGDVWRLLLKWERIAKTAGLRTETPATNGATPAAPAIQKPPIEQAEEAIRAFNLASESVDWKAIGASNLLRKKWLDGLLSRADTIIDIIQNNPPTPRK